MDVILVKSVQVQVVEIPDDAGEVAIFHHDGVATRATHLAAYRESVPVLEQHEQSVDNSEPRRIYLAYTSEVEETLERPLNSLISELRTLRQQNRFWWESLSALKREFDGLRQRSLWGRLRWALTRR